MELAAREPSPQRLDRVRLAEDVAEGHSSSIVAIARGRKRARAALVFSLLCGCSAAPGPAPAPAPASAPAESNDTTAVVPPAPADESRRLLATAAVTTDAHERCRLLGEAALLDPSSVDARRARAESRCAPAIDLVADARAVFGSAKDGKSAALLATVATRAGSKVDALAAADALAGGDAASKLLAARTFVRFGEHGRAAKAFRDLAFDRANAGAQLDALDAELESAIASAHAASPVEARSAIEKAIGRAAALEKSYGAAWIGAKLLDAMAALRNAGAVKEELALIAKAVQANAFAGIEPSDAVTIEHAIASARAGQPAQLAALAQALKLRIRDPGARAALAVHARVTGDCATAKAHARAHAWLAGEGLTLGDDVEWARGCAGDPGAPLVATVVRPEPELDVADAIAVAQADPARARGRLEALRKERPNDVTIALAAIEVASVGDRARVTKEAIAAFPREPWVRVAGFASGERDANALLNDVLPKSVEGSQPRARAIVIAAALLAEGEADDEPLDEALLRACAAPGRAPCLQAKEASALPRAVHALRTKNGKLVAQLGPLLDELHDPSMRLDVVLACVDASALPMARMMSGPARGPFPAPEGDLARAAIAAADKNCAPAKGFLAGAKSIESVWPDVFARIAKTCP